MNLPEGTVTFLFSDVEGSTQLLEAHPGEMGGALARHHDIFEQVTADHAGVIFETVGDAVYAAFAKATDAAAAALGVQLALDAEDWGSVGRIACRISLHTGDVERRGDHYFGPPLFRCARLQSLAFGEQTVLSARTAELVRDGLADGAFLRDEGWHRLKDLGEPEHVFTLLHPRLRQEFPALKSVDARPNNLPTQLSSFVGRAADLTRLGERARAHRLVTLTGPGGIGKTRLALRVASEMLDELPDGAFFIDLSDVNDPDLVAPTILATLGLRESADRLPLTVVEDHLRAKTALLVIDNFEQVISAASTVARLLAEAPLLRVLITSRRPLHVRGEQEYRVEPLTSDDASAEEVDEASRLFLERALAVSPDLVVSTVEREQVREIVQRLDGLPLAIELAAARIRVLSVPAMLRQLEHRLPMLRGSQRDAPERHRALSSAITWSYDLLEADDQRLFATMGVFAGGFELPAAAAVSETDELELLDAAERLVDASLLRAIPDAATPRFGMLETIREFALERCLRGWPEAANRHAQLFADLVAGSDAGLRSSRQLECLRLLDAERANIRAAMDFFSVRDDPAWLEMAAELWRYWRIRGSLDEGRAVLERAVSAADGVLRGRLLLGLATLEGIGGQNDLALEHFEEARRQLRGADARSACLEADVRSAMALFDKDRLDEAARCLSPALAGAEEIGDDWVAGLGLNVRGWLVNTQGDYEGAAEAFTRSRDALLTVGDRITALHPRMNLASLLIDAGELERAESELVDAKREATEAGESVVRASIAELTAHLLLKRGQPDAALRAAVDAERFANEAGDAYYAGIARALIVEIRREHLQIVP